jgi:hypothetical protein
MKRLLTLNANIKCIHTVSDCIAGGNTGTLDDMVFSVGFPRNTLKNHKDCLKEFLKELGIEIITDRKNKTFRFSEPGTIYIRLIIEWGPFPRQPIS